MAQTFKIQNKSADAVNALEHGETCSISLDLVEITKSSRPKIIQKCAKTFTVRKDCDGGFCADYCLEKMNCTGILCISDDFILKLVNNE